MRRWENGQVFSLSIICWWFWFEIKWMIVCGVDVIDKHGWIGSSSKRIFIWILLRFFISRLLRDARWDFNLSLFIGLNRTSWDFVTPADSIMVMMFQITFRNHNKSINPNYTFSSMSHLKNFKAISNQSSTPSPPIFIK